MSTVYSVTALLRRPIFDVDGDKIGRVQDLVARIGDDAHPPIVGAVIRMEGRDLFVPIRKIGGIEDGRAAFQGNRVDLRRFERRPGELLLAEDVLSRHAINVGRGRLIVTHDIAIALVGDRWEVVGVDAHRRAWRRGRKVVLDSLIDFAQIETFVSHVPSARLRIPYRKLAKLHPAQIADLVEQASHEEGEEIIEAVSHDRELEADVFEELDTEHQLEFLEARSDEEAARLLSRMEADNAADLISEVEQERRLPILEGLPHEQQTKVRHLLEYHADSAGGLMNPDFVALDGGTTVAEALEVIRTSRVPLESLNVIFVTNEDGRLVASVTVAGLVRAHGEDLLSAVAREDVEHVHPLWDLHRVARLMADFNVTVVPVVDDEHDTLLGVVTVDDLLEEMLPQGWRREFGMAAVEE
jgi:CBS domain-containing protein